MSNARKIKPVTTSNVSAALDVDPDSELNGEIESIDTCSSSEPSDSDCESDSGEMCNSYV